MRPGATTANSIPIAPSTSPRLPWATTTILFTFGHMIIRAGRRGPRDQFRSYEIYIRRSERRDQGQTEQQDRGYVDRVQCGQRVLLLPEQRREFPAFQYHQKMA